MTDRQILTSASDLAARNPTTFLAVVARSRIERIVDYANEGGWTNLRFCADPSGDFTADSVGDRDADAPAYTVFRRADDGAALDD